MTELLIPFGLAPSGRMVTPNEVPRGIECGCICPGCKAPLIARQGEVNRHHFAHASDACGSGALETSLHKMAKQIIADAGKVWVPEKLVTYPDVFVQADFRLQAFACKPHWFKGEAKIEPRLGHIQPDVLLEHETEKPLAIEIFVSHAVPEEKRNEAVNRQLDMIEIDLSRHQRDFSLTALTRNVLRDAPRFWICNSNFRPVWDRLLAEWGDENRRRRKEREEVEARRIHFQTAARIEAERQAKEIVPYATYEPSLDKNGQITTTRLTDAELEGWCRAARMRPSVITLQPYPGVFCSACNGTDWSRSATGWACTNCILAGQVAA